MIQQQYSLNSLGRSIDDSGPMKGEDLVHRRSTNKSPAHKKQHRYSRENQLKKIIMQLDATEWQILTIAVVLPWMQIKFNNEYNNMQ